MSRVLSILAVAAVCATAVSAAGSAGGRIVFSSATGTGGRAQVWVMNANGTGRHAVSPASVEEEWALALERRAANRLQPPRRHLRDERERLRGAQAHLQLLGRGIARLVG